MSKAADTINKTEKKSSLVMPEKRERKHGTRLFGEPSDKMLVENKQLGWHYVWVEDAGINLKEALDVGYEFVRKDDPEIVASDDVTGTSGADMSNNISRIVNSWGTVNYLMRIPQEWYDEDEAERDAKRNAFTKAKLDEARFEGELEYKNKTEVRVGRGRA